MPIAVETLAELSPSLVAEQQALMAAVIREAYPQLDLRRGLVHDVIAFLAGGVSGAINQTQIDRLRRSLSLLEVSEDPSLAEDRVVDALLSNYGLTRRQGARGRGNATLVVRESTPFVVPAGTSFTANGNTYSADLAIIALSPGSQITNSSLQRLLVDRGDSTYEFSLPLTADEVGTAGNLRQSTSLVPDFAQSRFVAAFVTADFTGGRDVETTEDLLARQATAYAAPVAGGPAQLVSLIKSQPAFADTLHYSIVGAGDPAMTRDQHSIFPGSHGGRIDVYARTAATPLATRLRRSCTLLAHRGSRGVWQFSLPASLVPGFYEVLAIRRPADPTDSAGFVPEVDSRGFEFPETGWRPDIVYAAEAVYSPYQSALIRFEDNLTNHTAKAVYTTEEYVIDVSAMPQIAELQAFLSDYAVRYHGSDLLVRGAVPCRVRVNFSLLRSPGVSSPEIAPLQTAIANAINSLDFPGELYQSQILDAIADTLSDGLTVGGVGIRGRIRSLAGDNVQLTSGQDGVLRIPEQPDIGITPQTVALYCYPDDVEIRVETRRK